MCLSQPSDAPSAGAGISEVRQLESFSWRLGVPALRPWGLTAALEVGPHPVRKSKTAPWAAQYFTVCIPLSHACV